MKSKISLFLTLVAIVTLAAGSGWAATITVGPAGPPAYHYAGIQAAIDAASPYDVINVAEGTYIPGGGRLIINKSITLQADPGASTKPKIQTNWTGWTNCAIQIGADNVVFQGFEVDNSASSGRLKGYIVGDYNAAKNGWTVRNCDIHNGRNCIRPTGNNVTIEYNNLYETESDLINCEYGNCYGLKVKHNWLHSHHSNLGGKPAGITYTCSSTPGADVEISYNYCWASRTFIDFQNSGGLSPANKIVVAHNTVDYWIGDLPDPILGDENAQQMSIAWWSGEGNWNGPNFELRDNLFTRQKWYQVVDTDAFLSGQIILQNNMFWQWYLNDGWYPSYQYSNEWPGIRGAVGWEDMGSGNEFIMNECITEDPQYVATGTTPDQYYAITCSSPAYQAATDGSNIGAWQGALACGPYLTKQIVVDNLESLLPTGDKKTDDNLEKALKHLDKSLEDRYWADPSHLTKEGQKVFEEEKKAVHELMKIADPDLSTAINTLVEADRILARTAIDDALAVDGKTNEIDKAENEMDKASDEIGKDNIDKAIEHYKKAWVHALKVIDVKNLAKASAGEGGEFEVSAVPDVFGLEQNYPNPFNPTTTLRFKLPESGNVTLNIYNITGQLQKTLVNQYFGAGVYSVEWNASDQPSGVYLYYLRINHYSKVMKMMLMK